jgi:hypothetical protein
MVIHCLKNNQFVARDERKRIHGMYKNLKLCSAIVLSASLLICEQAIACDLAKAENAVSNLTQTGKVQEIDIPEASFDSMWRLHSKRGNLEFIELHEGGDTAESTTYFLKLKQGGWVMREDIARNNGSKATNVYVFCGGHLYFSFPLRGEIESQISKAEATKLAYQQRDRLLRDKRIRKFVHQLDKK